MWPPLSCRSEDVLSGQAQGAVVQSLRARAVRSVQARLAGPALGLGRALTSQSLRKEKPPHSAPFHATACKYCLLCLAARSSRGNGEEGRPGSSRAGSAPLPRQRGAIENRPGSVTAASYCRQHTCSLTDVQSISQR